MNFFSKKMLAASIVMTLYTDFFSVFSEDVNSQKNVQEHSLGRSGSYQLENINEYYDLSYSNFFAHVDYLCWKPITEKLTWVVLISQMRVI
jgi:hypothetical protein